MAKKKAFNLVFFGPKQNKLFAWAKVLAFVTLALMYTFWALDMIPDVAGPLVGRIDDAIIWILAALAIRGAIKTIMEKKGTFLGG